MADDDVNIRIKRDTWKRLHALKEPGDSFDDVISDLLGEDGEGNPKTPETATAD